MLQRHSSRRTPLKTFLTDALANAVSYDRIAGYWHIRGYSRCIVFVMGVILFLSGYALKAQEKATPDSVADGLVSSFDKGAEPAKTKSCRRFTDAI